MLEYKENFDRVLKPNPFERSVVNVTVMAMMSLVVISDAWVMFLLPDFALCRCRRLYRLTNVSLSFWHLFFCFSLLCAPSFIDFHWFLARCRCPIVICKLRMSCETLDNHLIAWLMPASAEAYPCDHRLSNNNNWKLREFPKVCAFWFYAMNCDVRFGVFEPCTEIAQSFQQMPNESINSISQSIKHLNHISTILHD